MILLLVLVVTLSALIEVRTEYRDRGNSVTVSIGDTDMAYLMDPAQQELPLMSQYLLSQFRSSYIDQNDSYIPKQVWIAVRNISEDLPKHYFDRNTTGNQKKEKSGGGVGFLSRNRNWKVQFCDNTAKDKFMAETFANTSLLWAYSVLNPAIGAQSSKNKHGFVMTNLF